MTNGNRKHLTVNKKEDNFFSVQLHALVFEIALYIDLYYCVKRCYRKYGFLLYSSGNFHRAATFGWAVTFGGGGVTFGIQ